MLEVGLRPADPDSDGHRLSASRYRQAQYSSTAASEGSLHARATRPGGPRASRLLGRRSPDRRTLKGASLIYLYLFHAQFRLDGEDLSDSGNVLKRTSPCRGPSAVPLPPLVLCRRRMSTRSSSPTRHKDMHQRQLSRWSGSFATVARPVARRRVGVWPEVAACGVGGGSVPRSSRGSRRWPATPTGTG